MYNMIKSDKHTYYQKKLQDCLQQNLRCITKPTPKQIKQCRYIYIIAICGKAMASLAQLLIEAGYSVSGSDTSFYPPMSDVLSNLQIRTYAGYRQQNVINQNIDVIVVGNTVTSNNVETTYARDHLIPQISVAEALKYFIFGDRKVVVVAGTHGKTTTTGLLAHVLTDCKLNPGYLIGGVDKDTLKSAALGSGEYFIIEGDQYNTSYFDKSPKFLNYNAHSAILTSIQLDHVNLYKDFEQYCQAFVYLVQDLSEESYLIACGDQENANKVALKSKSKVYLYGEKSNQELAIQIRGKFIVKNIQIKNDMQVGEVFQDGQLIGKLETKLYGHYNMKNCLSVFIFALKIGCDKQSVIDSIKTYQGMKKRQQILFEGIYKQNIITVIDDYAHHPTAVYETLQGMRQKYQKQNIIVVFQFSSTSCKKRQFEERYKNCFGNANYIILKQFLLPASIKFGEELRPKQISTYINQKMNKKIVYTFPQNQQIIQEIIELISCKSIVIFMSACSFDGIQHKLIQNLKSLNNSSTYI